MSKQQLSAVSAPQPLEINGRTYLFGPVTVADFKEFEGFVRGRKLRILSELKDVPAEDRRELIRLIYEEVGKVSIGSREFWNEMESAEGILYMFWVGLRKNATGMTKDEADQLLSDYGMANVNATLGVALGGTTTNPTPAEAQTPQA